MKPVRHAVDTVFMARLANWTRPGTYIILYGRISVTKHCSQIMVQVFKKVEKQLPQLTTLDLQYVSPGLLKARNLELAVPGKFAL
jgi:hypothetical protein